MLACPCRAAGGWPGPCCGCTGLPVAVAAHPQKHKTIENVLASLDPAKYPVPDDFESQYQLARKFFHTPEVVPPEVRAN